MLVAASFLFLDNKLRLLTQVQLLKALDPSCPLHSATLYFTPNSTYINFPPEMDLEPTCRSFSKVKSTKKKKGHL